MGETETPLDRLTAMLEEARSGDHLADRARELCTLLAPNFGSTPAESVSSDELPGVLETLSRTAAAIGAPALAAAFDDEPLPTPLAHWLIAAAAPVHQITDAGDGIARVTANGSTVGSLDELTVTIELTRFTGDELVIDARVSPACLFDARVRYEVSASGTACAVQTTGEYAGSRLFGHTFVQGSHLRIRCARAALSRTGDIHFTAVWPHGDRIFRALLPLEYGQYSHLTPEPGMSWHVCGLRFVPHNTSISVAPRSAPASALDEAALIGRMLISGTRSKRRAGLTRLAYRLTRPYFRGRRVWLAHDKMYSAGDCGEYIYHYMEAHAEGFTPYYALNRDAPEVPRLREQGVRMVHPHTLRHRLVYLNTQVLLTTHANPLSYNGLGGRPGAYLRDLFNARVVCVQHGLSMQDIASFMHRSHAGIERYYCASRHEIANLSRPEYGYAPDQLVLTGIPRFDGLHSTPKRRLLIAPTWRPEFAGAANAMNRRRPASAGFLNSPFMDVYARVLTDARLLDCARETGYAIDFVLHPYLAENAPAFAARIAGSARNEERIVRAVMTGADAPYEQLLEESDLMVTDFSGVQYDFAYMGKPVVYFHPPQLPAQYGHGAMDYDAMGFGEVTASIDDLVVLLCDYMQRGCTIKDLYRERIETFFEYRDSDNCARILADLTRYVAR